MNYLLPRLVLWVFTLAIFPIPVTVWPRSFAVEVLQRITVVAPDARERMERHSVDWTERILARLTDAEQREIDAWYRDDYRIAWITVVWSQKGVPDWSWHRSSSPFIAATYQVLRCHPDEVWPRIVAARQAKLGVLYPQIWAEVRSPRKPVRSVTAAQYEKRKREAA